MEPGRRHIDRWSQDRIRKTPSGARIRPARRRRTVARPLEVGVSAIRPQLHSMISSRGLR